MLINRIKKSYILFEVPHIKAAGGDILDIALLIGLTIIFTFSAVLLIIGTITFFKQIREILNRGSSNGFKEL